MRTQKEWLDWCVEGGTNRETVFDILNDWEEEKNQECVWEKDNDWYNDTSFNTNCGQRFSLTNDASLKENGWNHCNFCGKRIKETNELI